MIPSRAFVLGAGGALLGYGLATTYVPRLSHHAGHHLVPVADAVRVAPRVRPRRALVVVVDGLRLDAARATRSAARLRAAGQCRRMDVGLPSVSRPVYAVLSTGLEQERTGARNNDETAPLAAESVWEVARGAGLRVAGRSELAWWRELFPRGFDDYVTVPTGANAFPAALTADVTLVHPVYPDEIAHDHGAASPRYAAAVRRVDAELAAALDAVDLARDLVVLTADHGHRDRGGHGGAAPEVRTVLTCFAGVGVARRADLAPLDARSLAPALAALLGLRFPRHLRAVEDDLDALPGVLDAGTLGVPYVADRRAAVTRFRAANAAYLRARSGGRAATWSALRARAGWRATAAVMAALAAFAGLAAALTADARGPRRLAPAALALGGVATMAAGYAALAGGLDATSLNRRAEFLRHTFTAAGVALALACAAHLALRRRRERLLGDLAALVLALGVVNVAHVAAYGWPLGYPMPGPYAYFLPFLTSTWLFAAGLALVFAALLPRTRRETSRD